MPTRIHAVALIAVAFVTLAGLNAANQSTQASQASQATPSARPVERLSVFEGTWTREGAPANAASRETCAWLAGGRRHMVCDAEARLASGPIRQIKIFSYRDSTYVAHVVTGDSPASTYTGGPDGDRWIFNIQSARPDDPQRLRILITPTKDRIRFVEETSTKGGPWKTTEDYTQTRVK